jgi:hypothetical protein
VDHGGKGYLVADSYLARQDRAYDYLLAGNDIDVRLADLCILGYGTSRQAPARQVIGQSQADGELPIRVGDQVWQPGSGIWEKRSWGTALVSSTSSTTT